MLPSESLLVPFLFNKACHFVDVYCIFRFEQMHSLSLRIRRLLKECLLNMLNYDTGISDAVKTDTGFCRIFNYFWRIVLATLHQFLADFQKRAVERSAFLGFWRSDQTNFLIGFFGETGLMRMLEASDCNSICIASPFIGAIVFQFCGLLEAAEVTSIFTEYVNVVSFMYKKSLNPGWT